MPSRATDTGTTASTLQPTCMAARLRAVKLRPTTTRLLVLTALEKAAAPMTVGNLFLSLRAAGTPVVFGTVYRALTELAVAGFLQRIEGSTRAKVMYSAVAAKDESSANMHRLTCDGCGRSVAFVDAGLQQRLCQAAGLPALYTKTQGLSIMVSCLGADAGCVHQAKTL